MTKHFINFDIEGSSFNHSRYKATSVVILVA